MSRYVDFTLTKPEGLLAHYTSASVMFEHILPTGELRFSPYRVMRDPVENKDILPSISWRGDPPKTDEAIEDVYELLKAARDRMRLLSLTRDADGPAEYAAFNCCWARPRMWEQYGDVHRGVCLLFNRAALEQAIREAWPREQIYMRDVDYTREGIAASAVRSLVDSRMFEDRERPQVIVEYVQTHHEALFFLKSDDFATEYEYRVVLATGDDDYTFVDYGDALMGIVLGERFPEWQRPAARAICSELPVHLGRMHWENGRPHVLRALAPTGHLVRRRS